MKFRILLPIILLMTGCSMQKMAGNAVLEYTHDEAIPYLMSQGDLSSACQMGQAMGPVVASMSRIELEPDNINIATYMASGMCAEMAQREAELDRNRALFENRPPAAQDALIREKQGHRLAALRMIKAYESAIAAYGDFSEKCRKYEHSTDELLSLLGQASGALAILHDFNSEKSIGISLDVPVKIEKAAACFDDEQWWGMPTALRASIWLSIPGSGPEGVDPLEAMQKAAALGDAHGVILARAMLVMMASTVGRPDIMCKAIADMPSADRLNKDYDMLNAYAAGLIEHQANIAWSKSKGHRAPFMQASCPGSAQAASSQDDAALDDLLDGLLDEETESSENSTAITVPEDSTPKEE